jgi:peptidyl-prolyl cis-trans isomerase B (cyclophilin B)
MPTRLLALPSALLALAVVTGCSGDDGDQTATDPNTTAAESSDAGATCAYPQDGRPPAKDVQPPPAEPTVSGEVSVTIGTSVGDFDAVLDADATPCTVNSFVSLAEQGYFDETTCHRMTTEGIYVLQCGDPTGTGSGGPGYSFADELTGVETYGAGTLAMANAGPATNGSQFFIVYDDSQLPAAYTVFGTVGQATVDLVQDVAKKGTDNANSPGDGAPNQPVDIESVTVG